MGFLDKHAPATNIFISNGKFDDLRRGKIISLTSVDTQESLPLNCLPISRDAELALKMCGGVKIRTTHADAITLQLSDAEKLGQVMSILVPGSWRKAEHYVNDDTVVKAFIEQCLTEYGDKIKTFDLYGGVSANGANHERLAELDLSAYSFDYMALTWGVTLLLDSYKDVFGYKDIHVDHRDSDDVYKNCVDLVWQRCEEKKIEL